MATNLPVLCTFKKRADAWIFYKYFGALHHV